VVMSVWLYASQCDVQATELQSPLYTIFILGLKPFQLINLFGLIMNWGEEKVLNLECLFT
jgi:hypothetical protein